MREIDYLQYIKDDRFEELSAGFERNFIPSALEQLRNGAPCLTDKQRECLKRIVSKYRVDIDITQGYLHKGYADRTDQEVISKRVKSESTKMAQANDSEDDAPPWPDDDIQL